jgi:ATP-dependent DNA helicase DinG
MTTSTAPTTFAEAEVALAASLPGYTSRVPQQKLAAAIEDATATRTHLLAQAGTGTGKSLGYLIPAILSGKRTVVSTGTKALQDQIANKDLPFLAEHLGAPVNYALLKGKSNYVCQAQFKAEGQQLPSEVRVFLGTPPADFSGERDDLPTEIDDAAWRSLTISSEECPGAKECPFGTTCYSEIAKEKAQDADVIVVNHALLLIDAVIGNRILGRYEAAIIDEAHELPDVATGTFTERFTLKSIEDLVVQARNAAQRIYAIPTDIEAAADIALDAARALWAVLENGGRLTAEAIVVNGDEWVAAANAFGDLAGWLENTDLAPECDREDKLSRYRLVQRATKLASTFVDLIAAPADELVRWVEAVTSPSSRTASATTR